MQVVVPATKAYQWFVFAICWLAGVFAGMNANIFSAMLPQAIAEIAGSSDRAVVGQLGSYVLSSFLLGWMLGGIFLGLASDRLGRVKALVISVALYTGFTALAGTAESAFLLALYRFGVGLGVGGTMLGISILLSETWSSGSRTIAIGGVVASYQVGVFLSGSAAAMFPDWRTAFKMGVSPIILTIPIFFFFRESSPGIKTHSDSLTEALQLVKRNLILGGVIFGSLLIAYWASLSWIPTWIQDLVGVQGQVQERNIATMVHGVCAIVGCVAAGPLADKLGRRWIVGASYIAGFILSWWMFFGYTAFSQEIYVLHGLLGFAVGVAQGVMYIYLPELFPNQLRATCVGLCLNIGRIVTVVVVLFIGVIVSWFGEYAKALSFFATLYLVGGIGVYFAPETTTRPGFIHLQR